jgi:hypothetical protein
VSAANVRLMRMSFMMIGDDSRRIICVAEVCDMKDCSSDQNYKSVYDIGIPTL